MTAAGQVVRAIFEHVHSCRGYAFKDSPRIKKFPQETTLHQMAGKRLWITFACSAPAEPDAGVSGILDVDLLVQYSRNVRLSTL
jgi:hypothetical protein